MQKDKWLNLYHLFSIKIYILYSNALTNTIYGNIIKQKLLFSVHIIGQKDKFGSGKGWKSTLRQKSVKRQYEYRMALIDRFCFLNLECNAHLQRDIQKTADETGQAKPKELKELISTTIKVRNDLISAGGIGFEDSYVEDFEQ